MESFRILIYAGTTEGRRLATLLAKAGVHSLVSVATEYGEAIMHMEESPYYEVRCGRLTLEEMTLLVKNQKFAAVVDATHPFATVVSEQIRKSLEEIDISYFRLSRDTSLKESHGDADFIKLESTAECVEYLKQTSGNILLTTGSKELSSYASEDALRERLIARVLPGMESLQLCYDAKLQGKQIIAMQGPFSREMNLAMIRQYDIKYLITKESGKTGGVDEKLWAAEEAGIKTVLIGNPEKAKGYSFDEVVSELEKITGTDIAEKAKLYVSLVGLGMGNGGCITVAGKKAVEEADCVFGAKRIIDSSDFNIKDKDNVYPYYLAKDIVPVVQELCESKKGDCRVAIVFSGDTGFYSGCNKMYRSIMQLENDRLEVEVNIIPGISSISYLSAKTGIPWQDARLISIHGKDESEWKALVLSSLKHEEKTFMLMSGDKQLRELAQMCVDNNMTELSFIVGQQMSYANGNIGMLSAEECAAYEAEGLITCLVVNQNPLKEKLTHGWKDEVFIRDKVPMTKEEIREISISKLGLTRDAVVYDIGSGTGSIAIEMAALSSTVKVYALEQKPEAVELINANKAKFGTYNIEVIHTMAPDGMDELPTATHAFIGGTKGNMNEILDILYRKNSKMRVVINAISLETISQMQQIPNLYKVDDFEIVQIQTSHAKKLGAYNLMQGDNPVMICSFNFVGE